MVFDERHLDAREPCDRGTGTVERSRGRACGQEEGDRKGHSSESSFQAEIALRTDDDGSPLEGVVVKAAEVAEGSGCGEGVREDEIRLHTRFPQAISDAAHTGRRRMGARERPVDRSAGLGSVEPNVMVSGTGDRREWSASIAKTSSRAATTPIARRAPIPMAYLLDSPDGYNCSQPSLQNEFRICSGCARDRVGG